MKAPSIRARIAHKTVPLRLRDGHGRRIRTPAASVAMPPTVGVANGVPEVHHGDAAAHAAQQCAEELGEANAAVPSWLSAFCFGPLNKK